MYINPFVIVVDRAERPAWSFENIIADRTGPGEGQAILVSTKTKVLPIGDYMIRYHEHGVVIERKTIDDLIGSIVSRHKWFSEKVYKMNLLVEHPYVVVEATLADISKRCKTPERYKTITRTLISWSFRYPKVHWFFMNGRRQAEVCSFRLLERYWKLFKGEVEL